VDVKRIIGNPASGYGCYGEHEMVVLGGMDDSVVLGWKEGEGRGITHRAKDIIVHYVQSKGGQ
jgi:hypothetical protein